MEESEFLSVDEQSGVRPESDGFLNTRWFIIVVDSLSHFTHKREATEGELKWALSFPSTGINECD